MFAPLFMVTTKLTPLVDEFWAIVTVDGAPVPWPAVTCVTVIALPVVLLAAAWFASISITFAVKLPLFPIPVTVQVTAVMTV